MKLLIKVNSERTRQRYKYSKICDSPLKFKKRTYCIEYFAFRTRSAFVLLKLKFFNLKFIELLPC